jgi:hypothetical protein
MDFPVRVALFDLLRLLDQLGVTGLVVLDELVVFGDAVGFY